jgi:2-dehydro-3-deoxyphosphogluconate aldolase/(4S)-4-hydroxy-2-oxoglutarate aldolase
MSGTFSRERFEALPIVGILRGMPGEAIPPLVESVVQGGITNLEVTMNTPGAGDQIRAASRAAGGQLNIGAGTVTSIALLNEALEAGAGFIVTPTLAIPVIERCVKQGIPVFPGAFTPTEIARAWELGATMVKVFPAEVLGPAFIRCVKGPMPQVRLMPTGGIDLKTLGDYRRAGADGYGVGTPLFHPERIAAGDWPWLRDRCAAFVQAYRAGTQA